VYLLDVNVLIALAWPQHVHHAQAHDWFDKTGHAAWATCPITQLAFVRISSNPRIVAEAVSPREAVELLRRVTELPGHQFWRDEVAPVGEAVFNSIALVGHRQVTDAYLLALAQHHDGTLATLDVGVAELIPKHVDRTRYVTLIAL
jgi:uncharacterized protein